MAMGTSTEKDHPRLCGEKFFQLWFLIPQSGSPPPMRGKVNNHFNNPFRYRITPAYAGKRFWATMKNVRKQDHPRLCGEKAFMIYWSYRRLGSPPPMRGKAGSSLPFKSCPRITPAYAGKRCWGLLFSPVHQDHPRLCGEKKLNPPALSS